MSPHRRGDHKKIEVTGTSASDGFYGTGGDRLYLGPPATTSC